MVGVEVASGVEVTFGVRVQPGGMVGKPGRMEQAVIAVASQSPRKMRRPERRRFVEDRVVEGVQDVGDAGHGRLGEDLVVVAVREPGAQRVR